MDLVLLRGVSSVVPIFLGFLLAAAAASRRAWEIVPLFLVIGLSFVPDLYPLFALPQSLAEGPLLHALVYPAAVAIFVLGPPGTRIYIPMAVARTGRVLLYAAAIVVVLRRREEELKGLVLQR